MESSSHPESKPNRKFESLAHFLCEKILEVIENKPESKVKNTEDRFLLKAKIDRIFDYFLDFSDGKDDLYKTETLMELITLLKEKKQELPSPFKEFYQSLLPKKEIQPRRNVKLDWDDGNPLRTFSLHDTGNDDILLREGEPGFDESESEERFWENEDKKHFEEIYNPKEIKKIKKLSEKIFTKIFNMSRLFDLKHKMIEYLKGLFAESRKDEVKKNIFIEAVRQAIKQMEEHANSMDILNKKTDLRFNVERIKNIRHKIELLEDILEDVNRLITQRVDLSEEKKLMIKVTTELYSFILTGTKISKEIIEDLLKKYTNEDGIKENALLNALDQVIRSITKYIEELEDRSPEIKKKIEERLSILSEIYRDRNPKK